MQYSKADHLSCTYASTDFPRLFRSSTYSRRWNLFLVFDVFGPALYQTWKMLEVGGLNTRSLLLTGARWRQATRCLGLRGRYDRAILSETLRRWQAHNLHGGGPYAFLKAWLRWNFTALQLSTTLSNIGLSLVLPPSQSYDMFDLASNSRVFHKI